MKAKEEAKRLVDRFDEIMPIAPSEDVELIAKQCALICVREVITELNKLPSKDLSDLHYWTNVENEINKLL